MRDPTYAKFDSHFLEFALVQFLEDGIIYVVSSADIVEDNNEKLAKYKDNTQIFW